MAGLLHFVDLNAPVGSTMLIHFSHMPATAAACMQRAIHFCIVTADCQYKPSSAACMQRAIPFIHVCIHCQYKPSSAACTPSTIVELGYNRSKSRSSYLGTTVCAPSSRRPPVSSAQGGSILIYCINPALKLESVLAASSFTRCC